LNVVFDLGGVVFWWKPDQIIEGVFKGKDTQDRVKEELFTHPDWVDLDKGILDRADAIERAAKRTKLPRSEISDLMQQLYLSLTPIEDTVALIRAVKRNGNRVFALSNMHLAPLDHLEQTYSFWDIFDGMVISCRIHMVKPDAEIYQYLLNKYGLAAEETVFIDDTEINLTAASKLGIKTIRFENPVQCEYELKNIGCI
jgi:putative hydrolase of the HAD superfamily